MTGSVTYRDDAGQEWQVREFVSYSEISYLLERTPVDELPKVVQISLIFELGTTRLIADDAPLDWRDQPDMLAALFARARHPRRGL